MHLVSRVNQSAMLEIRKFLVEPVTKILLVCASLMCSVIGIVGFIENKDVGKLTAILALSGLTIGLMYGIEYVIALAKYRRMQTLYDMEILNFHVHFEDDYMRLVAVHNSQCQYKEIGYHEITKCYRFSDKFVLIVGWQVFIFENIGAKHLDMMRLLETNGVSVVSIKTK